MEADASRYHGQTSGETDWSAPERQTRAVDEFVSSIDDEGSDADRKLPKVISPTDPCSAWTAKANKRVQFGYGLKYMIVLELAVIVDVEATPARTYDEVAATSTIIVSNRDGVRPKACAAHSRYRLWNWQAVGLAPRQGHHAAYSSVGSILTNRRYVLPSRLHLRQRARRLYLSEWPVFGNLRYSS